MVVKEAVFIGSFGDVEQLPKTHLPEIAFVGRANVGKSSLINKLLGTGKLARTSSKPGKTRNLNFFRVNGACHFVDLPGYGYSRVSKSEQARWKRLIENYLLNRPTLRLLVVLIDARHGALDNDRRLLEWVEENKLPHVVALTKSDKLSRNRLAAAVKPRAGAGGGPAGPVHCSASTGLGLQDLWRAVDSALAGRNERK